MKRIASTICALALAGCSSFSVEARWQWRSGQSYESRNEPAPERRWEQNYRLDRQGRPNMYGRDEDQIQPRYRNR